jgi:hypothetical protein
VQNPKPTAAILSDAEGLRRARLLCADLRAERLLAQAPQALLLLADRLLQSLRRP